VSALWEEEAAAYDAVYDDPSGGRLVRARLDAALSFLPTEPGSGLDVGMGGGRLVEELDRRGWQMSGTDASAAMVELAGARVPSRAETLTQAQIERLPFADASFDTVIALGVLEYSTDVGEALRELGRVARPNGSVVVSYPNFDGLRSRIRRPVRRLLGRGTARHVLGEDAFGRLADTAGLQVGEVRRLGPSGQSAGKSRAVQLVFSTLRRP
jgi:2-polyprenyl-3-methyl-5-hydroxy-6-metoxy-1,4-benzoquinol methylase